MGRYKIRGKSSIDFIISMLNSYYEQNGNRRLEILQNPSARIKYAYRPISLKEPFNTSIDFRGFKCYTFLLANGCARLMLTVDNKGDLVHIEYYAAVPDDALLNTEESRVALMMYLAAIPSQIITTVDYIFKIDTVADSEFPSLFFAGYNPAQNYDEAIESMRLYGMIKAYPFLIDSDDKPIRESIKIDVNIISPCNKAFKKNVLRRTPGKAIRNVIVWLLIGCAAFCAIFPNSFLAQAVRGCVAGNGITQAKNSLTIETFIDLFNDQNTGQAGKLKYSTRYISYDSDKLEYTYTLDDYNVIQIISHTKPEELEYVITVRAEDDNLYGSDASNRQKFLISSRAMITAIAENYGEDSERIWEQVSNVLYEQRRYVGKKEEIYGDNFAVVYTVIEDGEALVVFSLSERTIDDLENQTI